MNQILKKSFNSIDELRLIAKELLFHIKPGIAVGFSGKLGVGKTELVRQISSLLEVKEDISSPTYALENIYSYTMSNGLGSVSHWDLYRLKEADFEVEQEILELKQEEKAIILIEWPKLVNHLLDMHVLLSFSDFDSREITVLKA